MARQRHGRLGRSHALVKPVNTIYTPAALTEALRKILEARLPFVWLKGEIGSLTRAASGHIYFTLKDVQAQIQCVWFAHRQRAAGQNFDPLTGEVFDEPMPSAADMLAVGMEVMCAGAVNIYGLRSQYQLNVEFVRPAGAGLLALEFEERKARYAKAGYFNPDIKKGLPASPLRVAIIASPQGAAIHDFLKLAQVRGLPCTLRLYPAPAQGQDASTRMAAMIGLINEQKWAQVIVLIRGGGSLEDLWAFNEDALIEAIYQSRIPVLTGIGHEVDTTLADLAADARAATPSHAAQLLWPLRSELWQRLDQNQIHLDQAITQKIEASEQIWDKMNSGLKWLSPVQKIQRLETACDSATVKLDAFCARRMELYTVELDRLEGQLFHSNAYMNKLNILFQHIIWRTQALEAGMRQFVEARDIHLRQLDSSLGQLDPANPVNRGYALLIGKNGIIQSARQGEFGEEIRAILPDGMLRLTLAGRRLAPQINCEDMAKYIQGQ